MPLPRLALASLVAGALLALPAAVIAQLEGGGAPGAQSPFRAPAIIDIDFKGGSIGDYLQVVKQAAAPEPVNVIVSDDVARLKANPVELRGVSVETALYLLAQGQVLTPEPLTVGPAGGGGATAQVFLISSRHMPESAIRRSDPPAPPRSVRVFSIRDLVEPPPGSPAALTVDPETLMSSIDAALSLHGEREGRDVLFHPEAGILIVRAANDELAVTSELLAEIRNDILGRRQSARQMADRLQSLDRRVGELTMQLEVARAEVDYARHRLEEAEKLASQGNMPASGVADIRLELFRAEATRESAEMQLDMAQKERDGHRAQAPAGDDRQSLLNEITRLKAEVAALRAELNRGGQGEREGGAGRPGQRDR